MFHHLEPLSPLFGVYSKDKIDVQITLKVPNTTIAEFANTPDPDETAMSRLIWIYSVCLLDF